MLVYAGCELRGSFAGAWSSLAILVYKDPLHYLPFGICAIYFDLKV